MIILFFIFGLIAVVSAIGVVACKNPIHSALNLVVNLVMMAAFFAMLEAHFLAAVQIVVYAGAIMVLVLFMLMLLNVKVEQRTRRELMITIASIAIGAGFVCSLVPLAYEAFGAFPEAKSVDGSVEAIGRVLFRDYVFLFQSSGLLLMVAIVAATMLAKRKNSA